MTFEVACKWEQVAGKTREEWQQVYESMKRVGRMLLVAKENALKEFEINTAAAMDKDFDAIMHAAVLVQVVIDSDQWNSKDRKLN